MKLQIGALFLMSILLSANFVMPGAAAGIDRANVNTAKATFSTVDYFHNGSKFVEVCEVVTQGGDLNVRATTKNNSKIIGKLPNGAKVNVLSRGDYISDISASLKGKVIKGWVSNDYLKNCH